MREKEKNKKQQFVVIGLGSFGTSVAQTLYEMDKEVLAIDLKEDLVQDISEFVTYAVQADAMDEEVLERLGIQNFDVAIVGIGNNMEASIMVTLLLKELGIKHIITKATTDMQAKALYRIGADRVVMPEEEMGKRVARNISTTNLIDYIELSEEYSIFEFKCPDTWVGRSIVDLDVRAEYGVTILGIKRGKEFEIIVKPDLVFDSEDIFILLGDKKVFKNNLENS